MPDRIELKPDIKGSFKNNFGEFVSRQSDNIYLSNNPRLGKCWIIKIYLHGKPNPRTEPDQIMEIPQSECHVLFTSLTRRVFRLTEDAVETFVLSLIDRNAVKDVWFTDAAGVLVQFVVGDNRRNVIPFAQWVKRNKSWVDSQRQKKNESFLGRLKGLALTE